MQIGQRTGVWVIAMMIGSGALALLGGCAPERNRGTHATGTIEMTETTVSSKVGGRIVNLPVAEGQTVQTNDLLAELDHAELDDQIVAAQSSLETARLRYQKTSGAVRLAGQSGVTIRNAQIELAQHNLEIARNNQGDADRNFSRIEQLYRQGLVSQAEYDAVLTKQRNAAAQYQVALNSLMQAKAAPNTDDLDFTNQQAAAQIKQAQSNLDLLRIQLQNTRITAPCNGVLSAKLAQRGELVGVGTALFTILDYAKPWVKIYLPLKEVEQVTLNQQAYLQLDAYPKRKFYGRVSFIAQEAEFTPKDFLSREERVKQVFAVKVELRNQAGILKAGLPADVTIETKE